VRHVVFFPIDRNGAGGTDIDDAQFPSVQQVCGSDDFFVYLQRLRLYGANAADDQPVKITVYQFSFIGREQVLYQELFTHLRRIELDGMFRVDGISNFHGVAPFCLLGSVKIYRGQPHARLRYAGN